MSVTIDLECCPIEIRTGWLRLLDWSEFRSACGLKYLEGLSGVMGELCDGEQQ